MKKPFPVPAVYLLVYFQAQSSLQAYFGQAQMTLLFQFPFVRHSLHSSARGESPSLYSHPSEVTFLEPRAEDRYGPWDLVQWHKHFPHFLGYTNPGIYQRLPFSFHGRVALVAGSRQRVGLVIELHF